MSDRNMHEMQSMGSTAATEQKLKAQLAVVTDLYGKLIGARHTSSSRKITDEVGSALPGITEAIGRMDRDSLEAILAVLLNTLGPLEETLGDEAALDYAVTRNALELVNELRGLLSTVNNW